jgi:hypothetical protein
MSTEKERIAVLLEDAKTEKGGGFPLPLLVNGVMHPIVDEGPQTLAELASRLPNFWANKKRVIKTLGGFENIARPMLEQLESIGQVKEENGKWTTGDKFRFGRSFRLFQSPGLDMFQFTIKTKEVRDAESAAGQARLEANMAAYEAEKARAGREIVTIPRIKTVPGYRITNPIRDLVGKDIDWDANVLGKLWLEKGSYGTVLGLSGIGKSVIAMQAAFCAACGRAVFDIPVDRPLRVLLAQAEDSKNDLTKQVNGLFSGLQLTEEEQQLIKTNFDVITIECGDRGEALFANLRKVLKGSRIDLLILNPLFAFVEGSMANAEAVNTFLRVQLERFCKEKGCAALLVHHQPKPPKKKSKSGSDRDVDTMSYAGFGSVELTNAPRASITINRTQSSRVFEFVIGKRGVESGWEPDHKGEYRKMFSHSQVTHPTYGPQLCWYPATEGEIAEATNGVSEDDLSKVFPDDSWLNFETIQARFLHYGYPQEGETLMELLENRVERGLLVEKTFDGGALDGQQVWRRPLSRGMGKHSQGRVEEDILFHIEQSMSSDPPGLNTTQLRNLLRGTGNEPIAKALKELHDGKGKLIKQSDGTSRGVRYLLK